MTLEQIAMMAAAAKVLKEGGAYNVEFIAHVEPRVFLPADKFVSALASTQATPVVIMHTSAKRHWQATVSIHGVTFFALYEPDQLPQIGYRLVDGRPVPINEEVC